MAKETKSSAELAREERKARIEKASEAQEVKKEKKANQTKAQKRAKWLVPTIVVVVALVLALLYYFGVPHRAFAAVKFDGGSKVSVAEYEYYYKAVYNNLANTSYQYEQYYGAYYGEGAGAQMTGFDFAKTPKAQEFTLTEEDTGIALDKEKYGENPTWADFLKEYAIQQSREINAIYNAAVKDGTKLTKDQQAEIDEQIEELRSSAAESNYSLNAYLMQTYGRGMNEKMLRKIMEKQTIASAYITAKEEEFTNAVSDDDIQKEFKENPGAYKSIDLYYFSFDAEVATNVEAQEATETTEAVEGTNYTDEELAAMTKKNKEEAKANADEFYAAASIDNFASLALQYAPEDSKDYYDPSSESFSEAAYLAEDVTGDTLTQYFSEDITNWAYDEARQVGDKYLATIEEDDGCVSYIIVALGSLPTTDDTLQPVAVRHILFALTEEKETTDEDGNATTETVEKRTAEEAYAEAEKVMNAWVKDGAKEEDFITLASEKSEDPGSADNGGLYEDITTTSTYVEPFMDWCFAEGRKVGDYGIVETEYGAHIMYMSSISDKTLWQQDIITALATKASNDFYDGIVTDKAYDGKVSNGLINRTSNRIEKYAEKVVANLKSQMEQANANSAAVQTVS